MRELPFELVVEILARVPVKDLIRFRCVSKSWRSLFQEERFIRWHMSHAPRKIVSHNGSKVPLCNFIYESDTKAILQEVDLNIGDKSLLPIARVIGHCHGLFCLDLRDNSIGIWNPSLRELRRIPPAGHVDNWAEIGFGYDHSTQDYKIVMLILPHRSKAQVLSLKSGLSRMIDVPCFENPHHVMRQRGTLVGENIYWHAFGDGTLNFAGTMLSFNLVSETFNYSPDTITGDQPVPLVFLEEFRGLCTIGIDQDGKLGDELVIWSATHDEKGVIKSWSNILRLPWGIIESSISPRVDISWLQSAATYEGSSLLLLVAGFGRETKLIAYNLEEKSFRLVETSLSVATSGRLHTYTETLVPIPLIN